MANVLVLLSDLQSGRSSSTVKVRLLRFWEAKNVRRGGELMGVDMLLVDSQSTMMPATVNVHRLATHQPNLEAGSVYSLTGFEVARCNQNYLSVGLPSTDPAVPIPLESFRFSNYSEMLDDLGY